MRYVATRHLLPFFGAVHVRLFPERTERALVAPFDLQHTSVSAWSDILEGMRRLCDEMYAEEMGSSCPMVYDTDIDGRGDAAVVGACWPMLVEYSDGELDISAGQGRTCQGRAGYVRRIRVPAAADAVLGLHSQRHGAALNDGSGGWELMESALSTDQYCAGQPSFLVDGEATYLHACSSATRGFLCTVTCVKIFFALSSVTLVSWTRHEEYDRCRRLRALCVEYCCGNGRAVKPAKSACRAVCLIPNGLLNGSPPCPTGY